MYEAIRNSTIRMIRDEAESFSPSMSYYDWDAHAETAELPDGDVAGIVGFALTNEGEFQDIVCGVGIMTQNDHKIYRLTSIVDHFYKLLKPQARFTVYNADGSPFGVATCFSGTTVSPATQVDVRPAQTLQFTARLVPGGT